MLISGEDVTELLRSTEPDPVLVIVGGRAEVVDRALLEGERYRGALTVAERDDVLGGRDPAQFSGEDIDALARRLDTSASRLGG